MVGIRGISPFVQRPTLRMGAQPPNPKVIGHRPDEDLAPGPAIVRQRGERVEDPFRTPDLPPATEANETRAFEAVKTLFAPEAADITRMKIDTETRSVHGQRQLGVNILVYYNHPTFVNQKSPDDKDHTMRHAYNRLDELGTQGFTLNKRLEPTGVVVDGIPVRLIMGHYLAPNEVVLGGGQVATLTNGSVMGPSRINRQAAEETP